MDNLDSISSKNFIIEAGKSIRKVRHEKGLSLEELSNKINISRLTLSKIEKGDANPTISIMWKICETLSIPFAQLFDINEDIKLSRANNSVGIESDDKSFRIELIFREDAPTTTEFYRTYLSKGGVMFTEEHNKGTIEIVTVMKGEISISIGEEVFILKEYDSLKFKADRKHSYKNLNDDESVIHMSVIYKMI
ncbi:helix-turn-helix domain-containing protein [Clostridium sp.]|uniref:helix-turn-helix domain-containing protein n=1 Tax=Clostridium sp. TaxID=1506 RepID=UPI003993A48F